MAQFRIGQGVSQSSVNAALANAGFTGKKAKPGRTVTIPDIIDMNSLNRLYKIGRFIGAPSRAPKNRARLTS